MVSYKDNAIFIGDNIKYLEQSAKRGDLFDVIYIDPPYNTGNSFSYNDKRSSYGWIEFMRPRLELAHRILCDDGVIFISIDDSSVYHLKILLDEIFSEGNFVGNLITKQAMRSNSKHINTIHEYILVFAKNKKKLGGLKIKRINNPSDARIIKNIRAEVKREFKKNGQKSAEKKLSKLNNEYMKAHNFTWLRNYSLVDDYGEIFCVKDLSTPGEPNELVIDEIGLKLSPLKTRKWSTKHKILSLHEKGMLYFKNGRTYEKHYLHDSVDNVVSIMDFYSRQGTNDLNKLGLRDIFDTPKSVEMLKYLIRISTFNKKSASILDFFAGSGTTAQAVVEINHEDGKDFNFHICQLDEPISPKSKQYEFAKNNNLELTVDQLTILRLKTVYEKMRKEEDFKIEILE